MDWIVYFSSRAAKIRKSMDGGEAKFLQLTKLTEDPQIKSMV